MAGDPGGAHLESGLTRSRASKAGEIKDSSKEHLPRGVESAEQKVWWKELRLIRFC